MIQNLMCESTVEWVTADVTTEAEPNSAAHLFFLPALANINIRLTWASALSTKYWCIYEEAYLEFQKFCVPFEIHGYNNGWQLTGCIWLRSSGVSFWRAWTVNMNATCRSWHDSMTFKRTLNRGGKVVFSFLFILVLKTKTSKGRMFCF